jgi:hypothetical protein
VQRAQQGAARALFPILCTILCTIFGKANSRDFSSQKNINNRQKITPVGVKDDALT